MKLAVIRNEWGEIVNWFDTMELAEKELAYFGEDYEATEASIGEVFEHVFQGMTIDEVIEGMV